MDKLRRNNPQQSWFNCHGFGSQLSTINNQPSARLRRDDAVKAWVNRHELFKRRPPRFSGQGSFSRTGFGFTNHVPPPKQMGVPSSLSEYKAQYSRCMLLLLSCPPIHFHP